LIHFDIRIEKVFVKFFFLNKKIISDIDCVLFHVSLFLCLTDLSSGIVRTHILDFFFLTKIVATVFEKNEYAVFK
jgi:hypothetical protein